MRAKVGAVVPAAGRGSRFGSGENKIWVEIAGRSILEWTLAALDSHPRMGAIVLVGVPDELERLRAAAARFAKVSAVVAGGASRQESVANGLAALPPDCEIVLVHDAARPAISHDLISRVIEQTERCGAAIPGLPVTDTVKRVEGDSQVVETVSRDGLWTVQTPQGARLDLLRSAYEQLGPRIAALTDESSILEAAGIPVAMVQGDERNLKVTRPEDVARAARVLGEQGSGGAEERRSMEPSTLNPQPSTSIRTGFGYDVHAFADGRPLWLGGVEIPHGRGLAGHSDADVLLHAVCDALLGAAAMGDIGILFPDTDAAHKDRPSIEFVQEVRHRLTEAGWRIVNVDVALLAEEPRIRPYRDQIITVLADGMQIAPTQINIKATTSEKMGFVGRREGIACWAVATIASAA